MKKQLLLGALIVVSSLSTVSLANNFDFFDYDFTIEAGVEKTLFKDESSSLSDPTLIGNFGLEVKGILPITSDFVKTDLLLGTDINWSPKHLTINDTYVGIGFALGQLKYGLLSTLPENPLAHYWKGEGANNIAIYNQFDTLLKKAYRFESIALIGFSFHIISGTSGYVTGATNKPDIIFTISDIPVKGHGFQYQNKGLTIRYTTYKKKGDARITVAPKGTYDFSLSSLISTYENHGESKGESIIPVGIPQDTYKQRRIEINYDQQPLWWYLGYQQKQSREGWGDVSSVMPVIPSQQAIDTIKVDIGLLNELLQDPNIKFTWPFFKTHEILAGTGYTFGKFRPKAMVALGTIDKDSNRNIYIDVSECRNPFVRETIRQAYGLQIGREVPTSDYWQYILGVDYLINADTTLGISYGSIKWDNHYSGNDPTLQELGAWKDKRSFGLHISHRF